MTQGAIDIVVVSVGLRHLRYLSAVAETRHLGKAEKALPQGVRQSDFIPERGLTAMSVSVRLVKRGLTRWVSTDEPMRAADVDKRCTAEVIEKTIAHLGSVRVTSATINTSGRFENPQKPPAGMPAAPFVGYLRRRGGCRHP
ncbi:hypothetical protein AB0I77_39675 [Streptomyces sp. NPDC050619]|uniref:hypothetical protein n=1 Tax=Streptomyces sp. NPDC050619 TaxID=3157214 RepID=UPI00342B6431